MQGSQTSSKAPSTPTLRLFRREDDTVALYFIADASPGMFEKDRDSAKGPAMWCAWVVNEKSMAALLRLHRCLQVRMHASWAVKR